MHSRPRTFQTKICSPEATVSQLQPRRGVSRARLFHGRPLPVLFLSLFLEHKLIQSDDLAAEDKRPGRLEPSRVSSLLPCRLNHWLRAFSPQAVACQAPASWTTACFLPFHWTGQRKSRHPTVSRWTAGSDRLMASLTVRLHVSGLDHGG